MWPSLVCKGPPPISNHLSKTTKSSQSNFYDQSISKNDHLSWHGCHRSGMVRGKIFFNVREKYENFALSQGKLKSLKEVRKKWNFKSTIIINFILLPLFLLFSNIKNTFVHFTDVNHVVLLEYCSWNWMTSWCWVLKKINPFWMLC